MGEQPLQPTNLFFCKAEDLQSIAEKVATRLEPCKIAADVKEIIDNDIHFATLPAASVKFESEQKTPAPIPPLSHSFSAKCEVDMKKFNEMLENPEVPIDSLFEHRLADIAIQQEPEEPRRLPRKWKKAKQTVRRIFLRHPFPVRDIKAWHKYYNWCERRKKLNQTTLLHDATVESKDNGDGTYTFTLTARG